MHRGHDHDHEHHHHHNGGGRAPGAGHNHAPRRKGVVQWQKPHLADEGHSHEEPPHGEPDLDLVEAAFVEAFAATSDPTSFLRLARVPFEAYAADGAKLALLRIETDHVTDMGTLMPHLGGESFRYDPLPAAMVSRRRRLRFIYFDGRALRPLSLAEVRELRGE
jgi:hypothetical protein